MGDTIDGSSGAAQRAQSSETNKKRGFVSRLVNSFSVTDTKSNSSGSQQANGLATANTTGMLNLHRMRVEDVAIPKAEIHSVSVDIPKDELVGVFRDTGLTRLPVFDGTLDSPLGFVNLKDLALKHGFNGESEGFDMSNLLRPLLFVPPSMTIGVLLQKMQSERIHMALVIDEYGGVDGLVTIEDLIEQVIGEIEDEHDIDEGRFWILEKPGCYLVEAKTPLDELEQEIGQSLTDQIEDEEVDTLGGLIVVLTGRIPSRGEIISLPAGPEIEVVDADPRRLKRLRVRLPDILNG